MEILSGKYTLCLCDGAFPLSTDSMVLADFVRLPAKARVLDLGSGCGTLGLLLCAADARCAVTGVELTDAAHNAALKNIRDNGLENRLYSICADLRAMPPEIPPGGFDVCVSNPPYFSGGEASRRTPLARRDDFCPPEALFAAAARALRFGGDFYLVHKPQMLARLCALGGANGLEAKRLRLIRHREGGDIALILLQFRKGGKPGLVLEENCLFHPDGTPTSYRRQIYHEQED